jgi:hypothetical protein
MSGYWYCPHCREEVGNFSVTFQELHGSCGHPVVWIKPETLSILDRIKMLNDLPLITPEQYEIETGEPYADDWLVWTRRNGNDCWHHEYWMSAKQPDAYCREFGTPQIVCAFTPKRPPGNWKPEEDKQ